MSKQLTDVLTIYFIMAVMMVGSGMLEFRSVGLLTNLLNEEDGQLTADESVVGDFDDIEGDAGGQGWLENLFGPLTEATDQIFGGGLIAAASIVVDLLSFLGWPLAVAYQQGFPFELQLLAGVLVFSVVLGALKVLRPSA